MRVIALAAALLSSPACGGPCGDPPGGIVCEDTPPAQRCSGCYECSNGSWYYSHCDPGDARVDRPEASVQDGALDAADAEPDVASER